MKEKSNLFYKTKSFDLKKKIYIYIRSIFVCSRNMKKFFFFFLEFFFLEANFIYEINSCYMF